MIFGKKDLTLEAIVSGKAFADLAISPLQTAICRGASGRLVGKLLSLDERMSFFGCAELPGIVPTFVVLVCGIRSGKTFLAVCAAIFAVFNVQIDPTKVKKTERLRFPIIAPRTDVASPTFHILTGVLLASPLHRYVEGDCTNDTITIRRPDGYVVDIVVIAASKGGVNVRNVWLVGAVFEEVAQHGQESTGDVVNIEAIIEATETRLVPGGQIWAISSPYGPQGWLYRQWQQHFGKPGRTLVVHAPTQAMNPSFPVEQIEAIREASPDVAAREYDAKWIDASLSLFNGRQIDACTRKGPVEIPPSSSGAVAFAMDPGVSRNAWTLVGASTDGERTRVVVARQWQGSKTDPLSPDEVLEDIAAIVHRYGADSVTTDNWCAPAIKDLAKRHGLKVHERRLSTEEKVDLFTNLKTLIETECFEFAPVPLMIQDMKGVKKIALANGVKIDLPTTADGRHSDYAPSLVLAVDEAPYAQRRAQHRGHHSGGMVQEYHSPVSFGATAPAPSYGGGQGGVISTYSDGLDCFGGAGPRHDTEEVRRHAPLYHSLEQHDRQQQSRTDLDRVQVEELVRSMPDVFPQGPNQ